MWGDISEESDGISIICEYEEIGRRKLLIVVRDSICVHKREND